MSDRATRSGNRGHRAGIFDIRNIVGALLGVDGLILLFMGLFADTEEDLTVEVNVNLWTGLALLVAGAVFLVWARLRPVAAPDDSKADDGGRPAGH